MKKIWFFSILLVLMFGIWLSAKADVIPENSHRYSRCVKIENIDSVPGYKLVMRVQTVMWDDYFYEVKEWQCLQWHYKFGTATPVLLNSIISIEEINQLLKEDKEYAKDILWFETLWSFRSINVNGWYVDNNSSLTYINETYSLEWDWSNSELKQVKYESDELWNDLYEESDDINIERYESKDIGFSGWKLLWIKLCLFGVAWFLTVLIETIVLVLLVKSFRKKDNLKNWKLIGTWILASTITLPILWFLLPCFFSSYTVYVIFWEIFVTFFEVLIIKWILKIDWRKAIVLSFACNVVSFISWLFIF